MGVCRRAALYLARKKGKSLLLFLVFFAVSALLLLCVSVLEGTGQAARELRSSVGASFTIRPYAQMTLEEGEITQAAAPVVSQESIDQILAAAQGQVKAYNTEQYGYAKSQQLHFLPGTGDNTASNMGQVTAVRDSQLLDVFREEEYTLLEGRHIQPEDSFAVLLSKELTDKNGLSVGDSVTMYDLDTDSENTFTIVGVFLALGKGKGEILLQFFAENLLLALPAGAAALGLAALLGERAGDILAAANGVEGLDVAVRFQDAAAVYGLGALLLALAVLLAAATVLRCKPKDILSQME